LNSNEEAIYKVKMNRLELTKNMDISRDWVIFSNT